jgi:flagellar biosynthetic protein FliR
LNTWPFNDWNLFLLVAVRTLAMIEVAPLLSGAGVPQVAKVGLAGFAAAAVFPAVKAAGYPIPDDGAAYALLVVGEAMIGLMMGFFLSIVYAAFVTAGQFFSLQIGFGATESYDPLAEIEIPLMGQFLNLIAMFVFVSTQGFQKLFLIGVQGSFKAMRAIDLVTRKDDIVGFLVRATGALFQQSLVLSMPVLGTLFVLSVALGLLSKAAPQMNLLTEGLPISLGVTYIILIAALPFMMEAFARLIAAGFSDLALLLGGAV